MKLGYTDALSLLHRTFRHFPTSDRAHILGRFLSCPFLRVLPHLPENASVIDIGAGHGTFVRLATAAGATRAVAVEPDLRKSLPSIKAAGIWFVAGFDDAVTGSFTAATMFDVLYRIPRSQWAPLFSRVHARLQPGGVFLLKELDPARKLKFAWNRLQETISDRFLKITLGDKFVYASREETIAALEAAGFVDVRAIAIDFGYPHSHVLYLARKG